MFWSRLAPTRLDLLERDTEAIAQLLLTHSQHLPAHPHTAAHVDIHIVRTLGSAAFFFDHDFVLLFVAYSDPDVMKEPPG